MIPAVRIASETDDVAVLEGLGIPFKGPAYFGGRDSYGTIATRDTKLALDLIPDGAKPLLFNHGFDPEIGMHRIGGWSVRKIDDEGVWVEAQLAKRDAYYGAIRKLVDAQGVGFSAGSAEHAVRYARDGRWIDYPVYELSLTPTESNPLAAVHAVRSADAFLRIVDAAVRGWLPEGTTQGDLDDGDFAWLASDKSLPDSQRRKLPYKVHGKVDPDGWKAAWTRVHQMDDADFAGGPSQQAVIKTLLADKPAGVQTNDDEGTRSAVRQGYSSSAAQASTGASILSQMLAVLACEADEPDQAAVINDAITAWSKWIDMERAEPADGDEGAVLAYMSAVREGKRNSAADMKQIQAAHDATHTTHAATMGLGATCSNDYSDDETPGSGETDDSDDGSDTAARSARSRPVFRIVPDAATASVSDAVRTSVTAEAERIAADRARQLITT